MDDEVWFLRVNVSQTTWFLGGAGRWGDAKGDDGADVGAVKVEADARPLFSSCMSQVKTKDADFL